MHFINYATFYNVAKYVTITTLWASSFIATTVQAEATVYHHARSISFVSYSNQGGQLIVSGPGVDVSHIYDSSGTMSFEAIDQQGNPLPDGFYNYKLELVPLEYKNDLNALAQAEITGDEAAYNNLSTRLQANNYKWQAQSGHFYIVNGLIKQASNDDASDE